MKQEIFDLIHLNTYIDYSTNKASDTDVNELLSKCGMTLDENYLNFLRELNGFKLDKLNVYGTRSQSGIAVFWEEGITRGRAFENLDSFIDWAVKVNAKRLTEQKPIIRKESILHTIERVTKVNKLLNGMGNVAARNFWYHKMVIARLAGNPIYDELFRSIRERFENAVQIEPNNQDYRDCLDLALKMNDKLQKVSPLRDGMLV
jgi:hypothetical protein